MKTEPKRFIGHLRQLGLVTLMLERQQNGAGVSREIVTSQAGNVTPFAFDVEQGLSEHTAPFDTLVKALKGEVEIRIAGGDIRAATRAHTVNLESSVLVRRLENCFAGRRRA